MAAPKKYGSLEFIAHERRRRTNVQSVVLSTLAVVGIASFAVMAPNALRLLKHADPAWITKQDPRQRLQGTLRQLRRKGWVRWQEKNGVWTYHLTSLGKAMAEKIARGNISISIPRRWDGRWRIVMFDISEKRAPLRQKIRDIMKRLGFARLQNSVWVHPYDCKEIVALIKKDLHVGLEVRYVIADALEYDKPLREHFELPLV